MARIRTIKPEFFMSEDIGSLTVNARLLYVALWCHADRDGKMKFNKTSLKAMCMPFEMNKFDACIEELVNNGHAVIYDVDGKIYLKLPTFTEHQRPHHTEAESTIPEPNGDITVKAPLENRKEKERKGKEKEGEKERNSDAFVLPDWIPQDLWDEWMEIRKQKKAINSPRAMQGLVDRLLAVSDAGIPVGTAIKTAIERSWKSIEVDWLKSSSSKPDSYEEFLRGAK